MPKKGRDFPDTLNFNCPEGTRANIMALSYLMGNGGSFSMVARNALLEGVQRALDSLDDRKRKDFEEILENIKLRGQV